MSPSTSTGSISKTDDTVYIQLYSILGSSILGKISRKLGLPIYHSTIVVYGREYSFSRTWLISGIQERIWSPDPSVKWKPMNDREYFESRINEYGTMYMFEPYPTWILVKRIPVGKCAMTMGQARLYMHGQYTNEYWNTINYHIIDRNCHVFTKTMAKALVGPGPERIPISFSIDRLARIGRTIFPQILADRINKSSSDAFHGV